MHRDVNNLDTYQERISFVVWYSLHIHRARISFVMYTAPNTTIRSLKMHRYSLYPNVLIEATSVGMRREVLIYTAIELISINMAAISNLIYRVSLNVHSDRISCDIHR